MKKNNSSLITIVTVVFNETIELENTILSVINQSYSDYEYIIIDGGSTCDTLDIIDKYTNKIDLWVSEDDKGIYDAMNKGIQLSTGNWIMFLNCGDTLINKHVLSDLSEQLSHEIDVMYGDVDIIYKHRKSRPCESSKVKIPLRIMPACHQAMITKTKLLKKYPFNLKYSLASDFDSLCNIEANGGVVKKIPLVVASVSAGGVSDTKRVNVYNEYEEISNHYYGGNTFTVLYYVWLRYLDGIKNMIKYIIN